MIFFFKLVGPSGWARPPQACNGLGPTDGWSPSMPELIGPTFYAGRLVSTASITTRFVILRGW
jgi:hypothetical protein